MILNLRLSTEKPHLQIGSHAKASYSI